MEPLRRAAAGLVLALAFAAPAQTAGGISGRVLDRKSGAPLPGAAVTATGPLLHGARRAVTDADGEFLLPLLPAGTVDLDVQRDGFQALTEPGVEVPLGETVRVRIELFAETGQLSFATAPQPGVIPQGAASVAGISRAQLALLPYGRDLRSFDAALVALPGVGRSRSIDGASAGEHVYRLDGVGVNSAAGLGTRLLQDFIESVEVKRGGYRAEDGGGAGAVVQAATRSGGEALHGSVFSNVSPIEASGNPGRGGADLDVGGALGGPLVRDRLYFQAGLAPVSLGGGSEKHLEFAGKLDWAPSPDQRVSLSAFGDPGPDGGGGRDAALRYEGALADRTFLVEAVAAWHHDATTLPPRYELTTDRVGGDLRLTNLLGRHQLKYGVQAWRLDGVDSSVALFAQDSVRVFPDLLLDAGVRYERDQRAATRLFLPRLGLSWDFGGRGTSRAYAAWSRTSDATALVGPGVGPPPVAQPEAADQVVAGVEAQVFRDLVAGVEFDHATLAARRSDGVTLLVRKPFAENYLLSASYTLSRLVGAYAADDAPHVFKLDLAYLYEVDARTSVSAGAAVRLFDLATALVNEIDLRLVGTRKLGAALAASATVDLFNLTDSRAAVPAFFPGAVGQQLPFSLRAGASLSF